MDQPSSWALAPDRGIDSLEKEEVSEWDGMYNEIPSFAPELISSPEVRSKARSSGYGKEVPVMKRVVLEKDELRPWEEQPSFKPDLPKDDLRASARSSKYGKKLPIRKEAVAETPTFSPEVARPKTASKIYKQARSSGYGKVPAQSKRPKTAPAPSFKPNLESNNKLRRSSKSSGYGKVTPATKPRTDAPRSGNGFDLSPSKPRYTPRYTLLADKSQEDALKIKDTAPAEAGFVLDGLQVTYNRTKHHDSFSPVERFKPTGAQMRTRSNAASSQYGIASPPVSSRPQKSRVEPNPLRFDKASSSLQEPLEPYTARNPQTAKARSSQYGIASPAQGPKPQPRPSEPKWNVDVKKTTIPDEPPAFRRSSLNHRVQSHGYGKVAPPRGERYVPPSKPLWVPSNNKAVDLSKPPPVPRSALNDHVKSHYGRDYDPVSLYAFNGDDEFDDEDVSSAPAPYDYDRNAEVEEEEEDEEDVGDEAAQDEVY